MENQTDVISEMGLSEKKQVYIELANDEKERLVKVMDTGTSTEKGYKNESYFKLVEEQGIDIEVVRNELIQRGIDASKVVVGGACFLKDFEGNESDKLRGELMLANVAALIDLGFNVSMSVFPETDVKFMDKLEAIKSGGENRLRLAMYRDKGISDARRMTYKISPVDDCLVFESQELEKLAILPQLPKYLDEVYRGHVGLATVDRGDLKEAGYPYEQILGENVQNTLIDNFLLSADLRKRGGDEPIWDYLIGQRAWSTREIVLSDGFRMRPADLVLSRFNYVDGYKEEDRSYKKETHGEGVYMNVALAMILGIEVANVKLDYKHDQRQKDLEEFKEVWAEKRIGHASSIPAQVFDVVANYLENKDGFLKKIEMFLTNGAPIDIKHFDYNEWTLGNGGLRMNKLS